MKLNPNSHPTSARIVKPNEKMLIKPKAVQI